MDWCILGLFPSRTQAAENMANYMALLQTLDFLINKQLSAAAAEEILGIVGRIMTEYENQAFLFKQEIDRQGRQLGDLQSSAELERAGW